MQECASPYPPQEGVAESWGQEALRGQPALQTALSRAGGWLLMGGTTYQLLHGLSHSVLSNHLAGGGGAGEASCYPTLQMRKLRPER